MFFEKDETFHLQFDENNLYYEPSENCNNGDYLNYNLNDDFNKSSKHAL